jgi:CheY-like chemotaxis protein
MNRPKILIADDTQHDIDHLLRYLPPSYAPLVATSVDEARQLLEDEHVVLAILDLYLDERNDNPFGLELMRQFRHVPALLISGQDGNMIDRALNRFDQRGLRFVSKDQDLNTRDQVQTRISDALKSHYDLDIHIGFRQPGDWRGIALDIERDVSAELLDARAYELEMLVRQAFSGWDRSESPFVRATKLWVEQTIHRGDNSVVLRLSPLTEYDAPQAEVVLKITRQSQDHSKFDEFKNMLGGYGLRERRYARTRNYHAQVYSVPYFRYEQTTTYREFFAGSTAEPGSLERIAVVTRQLFGDALGHFAERPPTGRNTLPLRRYYLERINAAKRIAAIEADLTPDKAPASIVLSADGATLTIGAGSAQAVLANPAAPVLRSGDYPAAAMMADAALRHGDMHGGNVLVDPQRGSAWYIDYEHFAVNHYALADHVEMEAHILFNAIRVSRNVAFWARFTRALIAGPDLELPGDLALPEGDEPDRGEAAKALTAIRVIRAAVAHSQANNSAAGYYHALMFEALRAAGARSKEAHRRWHALVTAAQLFERVASQG